MSVPAATGRPRGIPLPSLTVQGWATVAGGGVWSVVAWLTGQRDLMWPGLFLLFLPTASWLLVLLGTGRPALTRSASPEEVASGQQVVSRIVVDTDGLNLGAVASYRDDRSRAVRGPSEATFPLGLGLDRHHIEHRVTPAWRGRHKLGPLHRSVLDTLGLARSNQVLPGTVEVLALPAVEPLDSLREASGLGTAMEATVLKTSLIGQDDVMVRDYLPGDDVRRIHWRSTARTGDLMVRREERAWDPSAVLLVDNRTVSYRAVVPEPRFEWVVTAAASISSHLIQHGFSVALTDTTAGASGVADGRALAGTAILRRLAALELAREPSLDRALAGSPTGVRGQLLIALLGRLDDRDAAALADASRDHRACWALVPEPALVGHNAVRVIETAGWRLLRVPAGSSVAQAWQLLGSAP